MKISSDNIKLIILTLVLAYIAAAITFQDWTLGVFSSRHDHDGLYISNQRILGQSSAWVINGSNIRVIQNGSENRRWISQGDDYIKINNSGTESYFYLNDSGEFVVTEMEMEVLGQKMEMGLKMILVDFGTNYTVNEVMMLLDSAYED